MTWWHASAVANAAIMWLEYTYRRGGFESFTSALPWILLPILVAQFGIFYAWRGAPSIFMAWAVFSLGNVGLRFINAYLLGEPPGIKAVACVLLMVASTWLMKGH